MIVERKAKFAFRSFVKNFKIEDFFCNCGTCDPQDINLELVLVTQKIRDLAQRPVHINSAYRCAYQNNKVGGVVNSPHREGLAVDGYITGMSGIDLAKIAIECGVNRLGVADNWCHWDVRPADKLTVWTYGNVNLQLTKEKLTDYWHSFKRIGGVIL